MLPSVYRVKRYTHAMRRRRVATKEQSTRCDLQDAPRGGAGAGEGLAGEGLEEGAGTERELCTEEGTVDIEHIVDDLISSKDGEGVAGDRVEDEET